MRIYKFMGRVYRAEESGDPATGVADNAVMVPSFADLIPSEYKEAPGLKDYKDIGGLIKSHINLQSMVGDAIKLPKEMTAENLAPIYDKLGRPKTAGEYSFTLDGDLKDIKLNDELSGWAKNLFHKHGLNSQQANGLMQEYVTKERADAKALSDAAAGNEVDEGQQALDWEDELRDSFGDKFDENINMAQRAATMFADKETLAWLEESGLGNNPNFVKTFAKIGALLNEDKAFGNNASAGGFVATEGEAKVEIGKLNGDSMFMKAYMNADAPGHKESVQRMQKLYAVAFPGKQINY